MLWLAGPSRPEDRLRAEPGRKTVILCHVQCGKNGIVPISNHLKSALAARFLLPPTTITTQDISPTMSTSSVAVIDTLTKKELLPDKVITAYLKGIAAASPREIRDKQAESPRHYRLLSQFDPEVIEVILKYARGDEDDCHRPRCRRPVHMTDALRNFKVCALCRAKRGIHDSKATEGAMAIEGLPATSISGPKTRKVRIRFNR